MNEYRVVKLSRSLTIALVRLDEGMVNPMWSILGAPEADSADALRNQLELMTAALDKPFLNSKDVFYPIPVYGKETGFPVIGEG